MYTYEELEEIKMSPPYQYALWCLDENNKNVGKYVKKQCQEFINSIQSILDDETNVYSRRLLE